MSLDEAHSVDLPSQHKLLLDIFSINSVMISWDKEGLIPFTISPSTTVNIVIILLNSSGDWVNLDTVGTRVKNIGTFIPSDASVAKMLNRLCPEGDVCPVVIGVQIDSIPEIPSNLLSQYNIPISLWSGVYYSSVQSNFSEHCDKWNETQLTMEEAIISLDQLPPCPPTRSRAAAVNSGFVKQQLSSLVGVTSYFTQWINFFHPGAESCFKQLRLSIYNIKMASIHLIAIYSKVVISSDLWLLS